MSFAFTVAEESWEEDSETGEETRTLLRADRLYDVSLVTYPAYEGTDAGMREDEAAEVVKRHRGYDPRTAKPARSGRPVDDDTKSLARELLAALRAEAGDIPAETPEQPAPVDPPEVPVTDPDTTTPDPVAEPAGDDEPTSDEAAHARALLRFKALEQFSPIG